LGLVRDGKTKEKSKYDYRLGADGASAHGFGLADFPRHGAPGFTEVTVI
jgi:hypothetical protein